MTHSYIRKGYYFLIFLLIIGALGKSLNAPLSALFLNGTDPMLATAFIFAGYALVGVVALAFSKKEIKANPVRRLQKSDTPYLIFIVIVDLLAMLLFLYGIKACAASTASLILSFVTVSTAIVAFIFLRERISNRLFIAILLITLGCITISAGSLEAIFNSPGFIFVLIACIFYGFSNVLKKKLADRDAGLVLTINSVPIIIIALIAAFIMGNVVTNISVIIGGIIVGIIAHGLPTWLYQISARELGASKCTTVHGLAPFIGAIISLVIFNQSPTLSFFISFILLIPGFYLVFIDKEGKDATKEKDALPPAEKHHDIRNYLTGVGFLLIFLVLCIQVFENITIIRDTLNGEILMDAGLIIALAQIIIGVILFILKSRNLTGMLMLLSGFLTTLILCSANNPLLVGYIGVMELIFAGIYLLANGRKKYLYSVLFFLLGLSSLFYPLINNPIIQLTLNCIICVFALILEFGSIGYIQRFPFSQILTEDENIDFSKVGSAMCYVIIAISLLPLMCTYLLGVDVINLEILGSFSTACGIMLGIIALLMFFVGKNRFVAVTFFCVGIFMVLFGSMSGIMSAIPAIFLFMTGLLCLLRKKSYLMLGLICILYGIVSLTSATVIGVPLLVISQFFMHIIIFVIALYMAVATFSQRKKLPLF